MKLLHGAIQEGHDLGAGAAVVGAEGGSGRAVGREFPTMFDRKKVYFRLCHKLHGEVHLSIILAYHFHQQKIHIFYNCSEEIPI